MLAIAAAGIYASVGLTSPGAGEQDFKPIARAVFVNDRLWLLHDNGSLVSLGQDRAQPERVRGTGKIVDICKAKDGLVAVSDRGDRQWTIAQRVADGWMDQVSVSTEGDTLAAIACGSDTPTVTLVTNKRVLEVARRTVRTTNLQQQLQPPLINGVGLATRDAIWLGLNAGEWGGGLKRISRDDGRVDIVEYNKSGELCGGPLNTSCDPVNGLAMTPGSHPASPQ